MGFEKQVLNTVAEIIKSDDLAEFYSGTLFVACNDSNARKIAKTLAQQFNTKIGVSRAAPHEYSFDFVA